MKNSYAMLLCSAALSLGLTLSSEAMAANASGPYKFVFFTNTLNNTYQSTMADTLKRLAAEHGDSYLVLDPDYDVSKQVNQMLDVANKGVSLAFLIPVDSGGVHAGLQALKDAGIPVINIDTAVVADDVSLVKSVVATDDYMAGKLTGEQMVKRNPNGGKIAILDFPENQSCIDRVQGFLAGLGAAKDKFKVVAQQDGAAALAKSLPIAQDIIQANPDLLGLLRDQRSFGDGRDRGDQGDQQVRHPGLQRRRLARRQGGDFGRHNDRGRRSSADPGGRGRVQAGARIPANRQDPGRRRHCSQGRYGLLHQPMGQQHR